MTVMAAENWTPHENLHKRGKSKCSFTSRLFKGQGRKDPAFFSCRNERKTEKESLLIMEGAESRRHEASTGSRIKRECLSFTVSLQECFRNIKATLTGQVKKWTAKNEKEATEADLMASKMQVDAAEEAEATKKRLDKSY